MNIAINELKKLIEKWKGKFVDTKFDKPSVVRQPNAQRIPKPSVLGKPAPFSNSLERTNFATKKSVSKTNESEGLSKPVTPQNLPQTATQAVRNTNVIKPGMYRIASSTTQTRAPQLTQTSRNTNPRVSTSTGVAHRTNVSRPQPRSNQMKDKVLPNNSQVKFKKTEVEDHPRIYRISNQTKSVTACNDSLNSRTSNVNVVCATCGKCVFNANHDACVSKYLNDVNARTKKPKVVPTSTRKPKSQANKSVATPHKKTVASESTITNSKSYYRMLYKKTSKAWKWWIAQQCPSAYTWVPKTKRKWVPKVRNERSNLSMLSIFSNTLRLYNSSNSYVDSGMHKAINGQLSLLCNLLKNTWVPSFWQWMQFAPNSWLWRFGSRKYHDQKGLLRRRDLPGNNEQNTLLKTNHTHDEAARTMALASKLPFIPLAEAIATACYTQNRSIIIPTHEKTAYHIINDRKPSIKHLHIFGCTCYLTRDGENLDKMKEKGDPCILVGYSTQSKGYRIYNKRTRLIVESIHLRFDEIKEMSETSVANDTSGLVPQRQKASDYGNPDPAPELQIVSLSADTTVPSQQELDLLFGPLYDEFFNDGTSRVNKSSSPTDDSAKQDTLPSMNIHPTTEPSTPTHVNAEENNNDQAEFTNPLCTPIQENVESSSRNIGGCLILHNQTDSMHLDHPEKVYRLRKALYGLKQALRAWEDILLVQIYVDDIIFGSTNPKFSKRFEKLMHGRFEMSLMGEMKFFLGLQIHQSPRGTFINQAKYTLDILKKHGMKKGQSICTPMATKPKLDADLSGEPVDQTDYRSKIESLMYLTSSRSDIVQAVCYCARYQGSGFKLTAFSGGIQFLGDKLVSWMSKKQDCTAMSSAEAEYVALSASCAQVMWMRTQLKDYGFNYNKIPLYCDSQSAIAISCNPVQHSRTKHIHTRYHFIKEQVENGIIELYFVRTEYQLADMFTKALPEDRFQYLVRRIGMRCLTPAELEVLTKESA
ncbi:retrovirus-related pol polyprotein from transposon TNT 1-94 [Tanacetum coccineum]